MDKIKLNDLLRIEDLSNTKIRFNLMFSDKMGNEIWDPIQIFKNRESDLLLEGHYSNKKNQKSYCEQQITIGFIRINKRDDLWLLFHIGRVIKDLDISNGSIGYEFETLLEYEKYFGRLIIRYKNTVQNMVRKAETVINECEVVQILPDTFENDFFPGYDKVHLSWNELKRVVDIDVWKTALQNQKGVYLITDDTCGKSYVGSAYGQNMILGRWESYVKTGHGGNVELKKLSFDHIKNHFRYSILDIYKSTVDDQTIIERESWWKTVLQTREFGYNQN